MRGRGCGSVWSPGKDLSGGSRGSAGGSAEQRSQGFGAPGAGVVRGWGATSRVCRAGSHLSSRQGLNSVSPPRGLTSTEHRPVIRIPPGKTLLQSLAFASTAPWAVPGPCWTFLLRRRKREAGALPCVHSRDSAVCFPQQGWEKPQQGHPFRQVVCRMKRWLLHRVQRVDF